MTKVNFSSETASDSLQPTAQFNGNTTNEIHSYFNLLYLKVVNNPDNQFCVDLDDIWSIGYSRRRDAVKYLIKSFKEDIDYEEVRQAPLQNNLPKFKYMLTVQCMEHLVVRRNKEIFEIYRRIFHWVIFNPNMKPTYIINVASLGIENTNKIKSYKSESPYPEGYSSMKQILKLLGYQYLKPAQVFKIFVERGLLKQIRNHIKIEKDIDIIYADDDLVRSGDVINKSDINIDTLRNQMIFKNESVSDLFIKAGINLNNEEYLSKYY